MLICEIDDQYAKYVFDPCSVEWEDVKVNMMKHADVRNRQFLKK